MTLEITQLDANQSDFDQRLDSLLAWESVSDHGVQTAVAEIVADVRQRGDQAVLDYNSKDSLLNPEFVAVADASFGWFDILPKV